MGINDLRPLLFRRYGRPIRKVCLRLGTTCPNRDGNLGRGGCLFCAEPEDLPPAPLDLQLTRGLARISPSVGIIAYLQDHCATYLSPARLDQHLTTIRQRREVVGITLGTRPDCLPEPIVDLLQAHSHDSGLDFMVELGLQSVGEETLRFNNRLHTVACFDEAVGRLKEAGLRVCAHVVLGLPSGVESDGRIRAEGADGARETALHLGRLAVDAVKLHNCHVLRGSGLERLYREGRYRPPDLEGYVERLAAFLLHLPPWVEIHRLVGNARRAKLIAPGFTCQKAASLQQVRRLLGEMELTQGQHWNAEIASG